MSHSSSHAGSRYDLDLPLVRRGKVRDVYRLPTHPSHGEQLLLVATDRVSAFDVVMPTHIDGKGKLLTAMSGRWFEFVKAKGVCETHVQSTRVDDVPIAAYRNDSAVRSWLEERITIGAACEVIPIECVVRGYLEGSGWKEYQLSGTVCGVELPKGLRQCDKLPEPIFTPATKADTGHDENISFDRACEVVGPEAMYVLRSTSLAIYNAAAAHAEARGIIIADTKFEFGYRPGAAMRMGRVFEMPILIDEVLTPDSSRLWPKGSYSPGTTQKSFDKQYLREYLETLVASGAWDKMPPGPELPAAVVDGTIGKYREALDQLWTE